MWFGPSLLVDLLSCMVQELVASMQWDKMAELWNAPVQPDLGPEWKSWKQEAMKWFSTSHPVASVADMEQGNCDISTGMESQISRKRLKLEVRRAENCLSQMEISDCRILSRINQGDTDSGHSIFQENLGSRYEPHKEALPKSAAALDSATVDTRWNDISAKSEDSKSIQITKAVPADGKTGMIAMANAPYQYRQCSAFIAVKGRQCGRRASDGEAYCCVHLNSHSWGKLPLEEQRPPPDSPMCEGMTTHGDKCKHRARLGSSFCKKHRLQRNNDSIKMNILSTSFANSTKREICHNDAIEFSSLNASNGEEFGLVREHEICTKEMLIPVVVGVTLDERNCLMNESELSSAIPIPVRAPSQGLPRCIGFHGQNNGEQCPDDAKKHTLYCEKHLPRFLKRARNGRSRLVSKDVFLYLLRNCCSRKQKLYLHQACDLLYGFMKSSLSRQKPVSKGDIMDWILSEASKDLNVGEYLLKLVSSEREKIAKLWSFATTGDKQAYNAETKMPPSTLQKHGKDHGSEKTVKCKICAGEFPDDQTMGVHWTEVHKKEARLLFRGYACAVCMSSFTNRKVLEAHVKEIHGVQFLEHSILFRCMSCNSHFVNPEHLWQHVFSFHLKEFRMPDQSPDNCHTLDQLDQVSQQTLVSGNGLCQNNGKSEREGSHRYICRFCGLKFDLLPDLGRHHQVAHMNPSSVSQFLPKRRHHYGKHNRPCHPRFKKRFGAAYRFKQQASFGLQKQFPPPNSVFSLRPKLTSHISENMALGRLLESHCSDVAETLFAEIQKTKPRPSNSEILSIARTTCCRINLHAALEVKYGMLPENLYLKAAKLCSELNIEVGWHLEGFICPRGCRPHTNTLSVTPLQSSSDGSVDAPSLPGDAISDTKWDMEEPHFILSPKDFNWNPVQKVTILCEDVSFGKEPVPVACVIDNDLKDSLDIRFDEASYGQATTMPWQSFTYVTKRLIEPSLGLDSKNSYLGCGCQNAECCPDKCDHVYLFDNDNEKAEDIYGKTMHGRFPYDERGQIILEEGYLVYECNSLCKCEATCHNRVLQKGVQVKLEIFRTEKKGWAVRAAEAISRGTFVCEYVGKILNKAEAHKRRERYDSVGCSYLYDIDAHIGGSKGIGEGTIPCIVDATKIGNVSRFINHSCSPNLVNYLVLIESMDCQLAHIGLYANRDIAAGEELAYDYRNKLLSGGQPCHCGAATCRHLIEA
ncbi:histone-lysine N-methyltransferase SUVR5 [Iris pallida]|uniref:Histone-lysine N-methyltransferase SUVR5 n=1 Tax=Iris pallida TaxID=29817 RepID=A0AAX6I4W0_IRIPA|nr:histone-lysine N-methyltransferase SUVR5 [Iris pallida]